MAPGGSKIQFARSNKVVIFFLFQILAIPHFLPSSAFEIISKGAPMRAASTRILRSRFPANFHKHERIQYYAGLSSRVFSTSQQEHQQQQRLSIIPTNQDLVQKRLEVARAKKAARQRSVEETNQRQLHIKRLIDSQENNNNNNGKATEFHVPALYAVKVSVCGDLRKELNLSGRERRGRLFIELGCAATKSLNALKYDIHAFFRALRKSTFTLSACLPKVAPDGSIHAPDNVMTTGWPLETDDDVAKTFAMADDFFEKTITAESDEYGSGAAQLKRPSVILYLAKDPNAPPPPPPPAYLESMADPAESPTMTMISFYSFPPNGIEDPEEFALDLRRKWKPFAALGRIYVAKEGVNAQMSIPTNVLDNFIECCYSIPELGSNMENGVNIDPKALAMEEFATAGVPINGKPAPPFRNLHIRVRNQIVADGLDKPLDWQSAGYDMPPLEWHEKIKQAKEMREKNVKDGKDLPDDDIPLILDCRNDYETNIGRFEGAEPLDTTNFRESWDVLKNRLENVPKDAPIMTYCTGGIRCVKVGAYLTQELGFTNVSRLAGGIIAYDRTIEEKAKDEEPLFRGANMVFDGRLGRQITNDKLGSCVTCGGETSLISNCLNDNCHKRIIQCESCRTAYHGTCSEACKLRLSKNDAMRPRRTETPSNDIETVVGMSALEEKTFETLDEYSSGHSSPAPSLYKEIELNTKAYLPSGSHMVSGFQQGRLLSQLASMTSSGRILEIGTFTGYATACLLEGAANVAQVTNVDGTRANGPYVLSMERDKRAFNLAAAHMRVMAEHGIGEGGADAACSLRATGEADFVEDAKEGLVSFVYENASCDLLMVSDALASVEEMALGKSSLMEQPDPFDMVFIDADKTRLLEYVEACLDGDSILKKGGLIVVDNTLWKGLVLDVAGPNTLLVDEEGAEEAELKKNRRARKLASKMHRFNSAIVNDPRCEVLLLQVRDGLTMIRKR